MKNDPGSPRTRCLVAGIVALLGGVASSHATVRAGMVNSVESPGAFCIAAAHRVAPIVVANDDWPGVARAAGDLATDVGRVSATPSWVARSTDGIGTPPILVGTVGHSALIDDLVKRGKLDVAAIAGRWESYVIQTVVDPMPGIASALVIAGSDKRGTIFGVYDVSENIGVSPWYWWADVPPRHRDAIYVRAGWIEQGPPAVKYRGIFLNDESPALSGWAREKFGGLNSAMYTRVFELLLRLRANYLWPAMWGNAFNEDDPSNPRLADEYGIVMGTSHQEAMLRAQAEFDRRHVPKEWNYATHPELMEAFWRDGVRRNKNYESLITIGMRGRDDTPMIEHATTQQSMDLLETIVARQRQILTEEVNPDILKVPQVWCLYKEVQGYYERGLRVPDDVTLLWSDDNWGDLRRVPTADERTRAGGAGIYYHFDYVGDPRNYKWLNTNPLPKIAEQMRIAHAYGADRVWIVNVGDLKPMELPIDFFMTMAWSPGAMTADAVAEYTHAWAAREFGEANADEVAELVARYGKYSAWRKPELIDPSTFSVIDYEEAERVEAAWGDLVTRAEALNDALPAEARDAFFQLVLYPIRASATVTQLYIAAARNALFAKQGRASANVQADRVRELFARDQELSDAYNHRLAGGKWDHMMDQTRIGYTGWQQPPKNVMPAVVRVNATDVESLGVAVEGSTDASADAALPPFDTLARQRRWIDVFRRGGRPFAFTASASEPWLRLDRTSGSTGTDQRLNVTVDWTGVPAGEHDATITIARDGSDERVAVRAHVVHSSDALRDAAGAFGSLTEAVAILADAATANVPVGDVRWEAVPDYGRVRAAMTIAPVTATSVAPPAQSPHLEYPIYLPAGGDVRIDALIGPTLPFVPGRGLRLALSIDDGAPQVVDAAMKAMDPTWREAVSDNVRVLSFTPRVASPGRHTIKIWMVDPGVVLEELIVNADRARPSYFGPPASTAIGGPTTRPEGALQ